MVFGFVSDLIGNEQRRWPGTWGCAERLDCPGASRSISGDSDFPEGLPQAS